MKNHSEHDLCDDLLELESQLSKLVPNTIPRELHVRLERSMVHDPESGVDLIESVDELELHLGQMAPITMPDDLINRMARAMDNWQEKADQENDIIPFLADGSKKPVKSGSKSYGVGMISMAAAVALLGAITALVLPDFSHQDEPVAAATAAPTQALAITGSPSRSLKSLESEGVPVGRLLGDTLQHEVTNTSDQGVIVADDNTLHRCIRVEYRDQITVENSQGKQVEITRPGVKYILLPVELY